MPDVRFGSNLETTCRGIELIPRTRLGIRACLKPLKIESAMIAGRMAEYMYAAGSKPAERRKVCQMSFLGAVLRHE
jgi:hypothetical protein